MGFKFIISELRRLYKYSKIQVLFRMQENISKDIKKTLDNLTKNVLEYK